MNVSKNTCVYLILNITRYNKISQVVVPVRLIVTGVALSAGFTLDEQVRVPSRLPTSLWPLRRLSDLLLKVQARTARRQHRTLLLVVIVGRVDNLTRRWRWWRPVSLAGTCKIITLKMIL